MSDDTRNSDAPTVQEENEETEIDEMDAMKPDETSGDQGSTLSSEDS